MKSHPVLKRVGLFFLGLIIVIGLIIAFFDWNWLREPIARKVSSVTGRSFAINGDLEVHLSLRPRIVVNDIVLGNAAWSREPEMAKIKRLDFRIDIPKLFGGTVVLPEIALSEPHVVLETSKDGKHNWVFKENDDKPFTFPSINSLTIDQGSAIYRDPTMDTDLALEVRTLADHPGADEMALEIEGKGRLMAQPAILHAQGGALLSLRTPDHPYPIKASATLGDTKASIDGVLLDPLHLKGEELNFKLEGSDLGLLFPLIGVPIPPTPPYRLSGFLSHSEEHVWTFRRFKGTVGQSDIAGDFTVDRSKSLQMITANLVSQNLDMKDLGGFIGASPGKQSSEAASSSNKVIPHVPFNVEKLQATNADITFHGEKILTEKMPFENMRTHLILKDGLLKLMPLEFGVAGGKLVSQIEIDSRKSPMTTHGDITAKGLRLGQMFPSSKLARTNTGTMGGHAKLDGQGNSLAHFLGSANGEAALIMDGGSISELMLRLSNLDIANSVAVLLGGDKQIPVRCMVGNFKAVDGDFKVDTLVLDTPKVNVTGSGNADFDDESLHLRLVAQSKGFSLASLRGPVIVSGTFKHPSVKLEAKSLTRGGLAAVLGVLSAGVGALIPLLDFGKDKVSNCAALIDQAKADAGVKASDISPSGGK